ncbi:hypothetical protein CERSUDRAFT_79485 [Gelatoporia subvermispora B]|uniref:Uncharacterized protein n=1 Tax=Ceriporiopsis subvermispora (strain B) TaxID=914234 RepID=M2RSG4_CERS8|nr:hypothetical protein CERSUDRAFT_79485 [Gelatoporia subvermispora B]
MMPPTISHADHGSAQPLHTDSAIARSFRKTLRCSWKLGYRREGDIAGGISDSRDETWKLPQTSFERFIQLVRRRKAQDLQVLPLPDPSDLAAIESLASEFEASSIPTVLQDTCHVQNDFPLIPVLTPESQLLCDLPPANIAPETECKIDEESAPEPATIARRIRMLISSLPSVIPQSTPFSMPPLPSHLSQDTRSPLTLNSSLISLLSSSSFMNGSASSGRSSIWSLLNSTRTNDEHPSNDSAAELCDDYLSTIYTDDDRSSLMLYGPIIPDSMSEVEIATSEAISSPHHCGAEQDVPDGASAAHREDAPPAAVRPFPRLWPFATRAVGSAEEAVSEAVIEKRSWIPSNTRVSLQLLWWGYRIYLPPPVLETLNSQRLETTKRAAIITTALKWLLDHIPPSAVPLQLRAALELARALTPYIAYVGGFIAWSWSTIKGFDKGHGVILSATWLLPIAPIPGTWED